MPISDEGREAEPLLLRIDPDITRLTNFGRSTLYREVAAGRLRAVRIGRAVRVRRDDLEAWLDQHMANSVNPQGKRIDPRDGFPP
jgi:excisionase family DNA binding protein